MRQATQMKAILASRSGRDDQQGETSRKLTYNAEALRWIRDAEANTEANERLQRGYAAAEAM